MNHQPASFPQAIVEPLEQRIAPALLINGANLLGGSGNPSTGETSIGDNSVTLVKVLSGNAIVWYDHGSITAISVGPNTSLDLTGNVGDIISNLTSGGRLSDLNNNPSDGEDGNVLLANNLIGLKTHALGAQNGDVNDIISGGSISNLSINGKIHGVFAGDGVFRAGSHALTGSTVNIAIGTDVNPIEPGDQTGFHLTQNNGLLSGASISNTLLQTAKELQLYAGNGVNGAPGKTGSVGGTIKNVTIVSAFIDEASPANTPSYDIQSGDGGNGTVGGAGGTITKVIEKSSAGVVNVAAGDGGDGSSGAGGAGGSVKSLDMQSDSSSYTVVAGKGGKGAPGGAGGTLTGNNFSGKAPSTGIIVGADFTGDGIDDILVVDAGTGKMIIEKNSGDGSSFTQVVQDDRTTPQTGDDLIQIESKGTTPDDAIAVDVDNDGLLDIVVSYKNSNNLGVYINRGGGVFYDQVFDLGVYTGSVLSGTTVDLGGSPSKIVAGNFTGSDAVDIAVLTTSKEASLISVAAGTGTGAFASIDSTIKLGGLATDLVEAPIKGGSFGDLYVGFKSGLITPLLSTGAATGDAFTIGVAGLTMPGGVANLDVDVESHRLLALSASLVELDLFSFDSNGALSLLLGPDLSLQTGRPLVAHFVPDGINAEMPIEVLSTLTSGSRLDEYSALLGSFIVDASVQSQSILKNFVPVIEGSSNGVAALGGSLGHYAFSQSFASFVDFALPFTGKKVSLFGGDGGDGLDLAAKLTGKGGLGGAIVGVNIEAGDIFLKAGDGGDSGKGAAGAGGAISNGPILATASGFVAPALDGDTSLVVIAGEGGAPGANAATATGGSGGLVSGLHLQLASGDIQINAGNGGDGRGGIAGAGGAILNLTTLAGDGSLLATAGNGGNALAGATNGGAGGVITTVKHVLNLIDSVETLEKAYQVTLTSGQGGTSAGGTGGAGGAISGIDLTLDPADESLDDPSTPVNEHALVDSTLSVAIQTGDGGAGATGSAGGAIKDVKTTSIFDQIATDPVTHGRSVQLNPVVMSIVAGDGGIGVTGAGGGGGSITVGNRIHGLTISDFDFASPDAPLTIKSGTGGAGATKGGNGGFITNVITGNSPASTGDSIAGNELLGANLVAGNGGDGGSSDGGSGGGISTLSIGVDFGPIVVQSGSGGAGGISAGATTGKGGAAGSVGGALLGSANSGLFVFAGLGGDGITGGGAGGSIASININAPQDAAADSAVFAAGDGGKATGNGPLAGKGYLGGKGGDVTGITQQKDLNSAINLIEAGNGGASPGTFGVGGAGGSVSKVQTVGLIGIASDSSTRFGVFDANGNGQGIFSGRGGAGPAQDGTAGAVSAVTARQIAAISATADANGVFALASKVFGIKADLIGYDVNGNGSFNSSSGTASPSGAKPVDGFILASAIASINTLNDARTILFEFTS
ncbi:MAG: hypothetical protein QOD99_930 [Chthoniobacter sp.]|nr:hypothetical protein [Chthoniobacter sp.]